VKCGSESIAVAVLAGGDGNRIGGRKPLRLLRGKSLVERAVAAARNWASDVVVVGRDAGQGGGTGATFLQDAPGADGPIAGLAAALRYAKDAGHGAVLAIPCDTPFLPLNLASRLSMAITPEAGAAIASSVLLHPSCGLWRARAFFALGPYLCAGRRSLHGFAESVGFVRVEWTSEPFDPFLNINTAADLAAAESLLGDASIDPTQFGRD